MVIRWHLTGSPIKDTLENEKETLTQIKQQWLKKKKTMKRIIGNASRKTIKDTN